MPPEGPNKVEELLQRYAKERRERGGDFSLHPATRRLLQGEVAREFARARRERRSWRSIWQSSTRARWVAGGALATIVIVSVTLIATRQGSRREGVRGVSARAEKELFFARAEQLVDARRESTPAPVADTYNKERGRGFADLDIDTKTKPTGVLAQKVATPNPEGLAFIDVTSGVTPAAPFNYSVTLPRAQRAPAVTNGTATQQSLAPVQLGVRYALSAAPQSAAALGVASEPAQFASADTIALSSQSVNSPVPQSGEAQVGKSAILQKQAGEVAATMQFGAPAVQAPQPQQNAIVATAPAGAVDKLFTDQLALRDAPAQSGVARYYRLNRTAEDRVMQRTENETAGRAGASAVAGSGALLNQFTIEQQGNTLRLREADGSVYEGALMTVAAASQRGSFGNGPRRDKDSLDREKVIELKKEDLERSSNFAFVLTGTNLASGQLVTVRGRFEPATNSPLPALAVRRLAKAATADEEKKSGADTPAAAEPLVIDGTIRVGNGREQPFRAVPVQQ